MIKTRLDVPSASSSAESGFPDADGLAAVRAGNARLPVVRRRALPVGAPRGRAVGLRRARAQSTSVNRHLARLVPRQFGRHRTDCRVEAIGGGQWWAFLRSRNGRGRGSPLERKTSSSREMALRLAHKVDGSSGTFRATSIQRARCGARAGQLVNRQTVCRRQSCEARGIDVHQERARG
jgi:hypothetical protein